MAAQDEEVPSNPANCRKSTIANRMPTQPMADDNNHVEPASTEAKMAASDDFTAVWVADLSSARPAPQPEPASENPAGEATNKVKPRYGGKRSRFHNHPKTVHQDTGKPSSLRPRCCICQKNSNSTSLPGMLPVRQRQRTWVRTPRQYMRQRRPAIRRLQATRTTQIPSVCRHEGIRRDQPGVCVRDVEQETVGGTQGGEEAEVEGPLYVQAWDL